MTRSVALVVDLTMISLEVGLETWVVSVEVFLVLPFQVAVWAAKEQVSKLQH